MASLLSVGPPYFDGWSQGNDYNAGTWYDHPIPGLVVSHGTAAANGVMTLAPFVARSTHTLTGIGFYNSSAAQTGRKFRMGVYASANGLPTGAPLADSGEVTLGAAVAFNAVTISVPIVIGRIYYRALNTDGALTGQICNPTTGYLPLGVTGVINPGTVPVTSTALLAYGYSMASAYGALPTIGTMLDNVATSAALIWLKG